MYKKNKFWIYIPLYLIALVVSVWGLYEFLTEKRPIQETIPMIEKVEVDSTFMECFTDNRKMLEGVISITSLAKLNEFSSEFESKCIEDLCGDYSRREFYRKASRSKGCFSSLLDSAITYHHRQVANSSNLPVFYNSGEHTLNADQKEDIDLVLRQYKNKTDQMGVLIIGRASKDGDYDGNKVLSKKRAQVIMNLIERETEGELFSEFVYFGSDAPQLNLDVANNYDIKRSSYVKVKYGSGNDSDFARRLNQSVLLVFYPLLEDPFGLKD